MPIQDRLGIYKYPNYDPTWEEILRKREEEKKKLLRDERRKKLEKIKEKIKMNNGR